METIVQVENLVKDFRVGFWGRKVRILNGVNLTIRENETFGLLGPNGAGKTTTLKVLTGLAYPTKGLVKLWGKPPSDTTTRKKMGFLPENPYIYAYLNGWESLRLAGQLFGLSSKKIKQRSEELLELVGLTNDAHKYLKTYSKGMLQRIGIAQALINDPQLVLLDEPMSGLDPTGRHEIREIILNLKKQGKTVFFNTHIISDVEAICDHVAIMVKGQIRKSGKITDFVKPDNNLIQLKLTGLSQMGQTNLKRMAPSLEQRDGIIQASFQDVDSALKALAIARQSGGNLLSLGPQNLSLERVFLDTLAEAKGAAS